MRKRAKRRVAGRQRRFSALIAPAVLLLAVVGCALYANLCFAVADPSTYRDFPPFQSNLT